MPPSRAAARGGTIRRMQENLQVTNLPPTPSAPHVWPTELRLRPDRRSLHVAFDSGEGFDLPAEYLRVRSPSAEVRGHSEAERKTVAGQRNAAIRDLQTVGNYAVRIVFEDGHSTGLYTWGYLLELGRNHADYWQAYLEELAAKGLTRG